MLAFLRPAAPFVALATGLLLAGAEPPKTVPRELRVDPTLELPAWGEPVDGVRLGVYVVQRDVEIAGWSELHLVLQNTAGDPRILNLGMMLGNGSDVIPGAFRLVLRDDRGQETGLCCRPQTAGRIDPWLVVLAPHSTYTYRTSLAPFRDERLRMYAPGRAPADLPPPYPPPGRYRLTALLESRAPVAAGLNSDTPGLATWKVLSGELKTAEVDFAITPTR